MGSDVSVERGLPAVLWARLTKVLEVRICADAKHPFLTSYHQPESVSCGFSLAENHPYQQMMPLSFIKIQST